MKYLAASLAALIAAACGSTAPPSNPERDALEKETAAAIKRLKGADAGLAEWFDKKSYGYAVFPNVGKGGFIVGGAHGRGQVYEKGKHIGYATLSMGTIGLQAGGQSYIEVVFFKDEQALTTFKAGNWEMSAQATAIAVESGASADADYSEGVAVFTMPLGGLMAEASIGGQKFSYAVK